MLNTITKDVRKISTVREKKQIIKQLGKNRDPTKKKFKKKKSCSQYPQRDRKICHNHKTRIG